MDQRDRLESPGMDPPHSQWGFGEKMQTQFNEERMAFSTNDAGWIVRSIVKKGNLAHMSRTLRKTNSK